MLEARSPPSGWDNALGEALPRDPSGAASLPRPVAASLASAPPRPAPLCLCWVSLKGAWGPLGNPGRCHLKAQDSSRHRVGLSTSYSPSLLLLSRPPSSSASCPLPSSLIHSFIPLEALSVTELSRSILHLRTQFPLTPVLRGASRQRLCQLGPLEFA